MKTKCARSDRTDGFYFPQNKTKGGVTLWLAIQVRSWKLSRRLGISLSGTGKELEKRPYAPGPTVRDSVKNYQNTVCNCKKSKNFVTCTV